MNGHDADGIAAYGPQDDEERMAAILAAHDEATEEWRTETWHSPLCPICYWELIPVEDGRMICPDCGHEDGGPDDNAAAPDPAAQLAELNRVRFTITAEYDEIGGPDDDPAAALAELNRVRFTIEIRTDAIGRVIGHTATAVDWPGGDQWSQS